MRISTDKITLHGERIEEVQLGEDEAAEPKKMAVKDAAKLPITKNPDSTSRARAAAEE